MAENEYGVVLVGHGGIPSDCPPEYISTFKRLESQRRAKNLPPSDEELLVDKVIRDWPRTKETDPYQAGLEAVAKSLKPNLYGTHLENAFNEFCDPTIQKAVDTLINKGISEIIIISTMFTPGGSHSEIEIPEVVHELNKKYPKVNVDYAWPFDLEHIAIFLSEHIWQHKNKRKP
jgi:sirohydrochlorin cobaltochelatase